MKNIVRNSFALICFSALLFLASCEKENIDITNTVTPESTSSAKILGEWEMYKVEKHELMLDSITLDPPQAFSSMVWFDQTSSMVNETTMDFNDDNTFQNFYADVLVFVGNWSEVNESEFTLTFVPEESPAGSEWSDINTDYIVTVYCDNSMSIEYQIAPPAGNHEWHDADWHYIAYFRTPGTTQCDDLIDYYVGSFDCEGLALNFGDPCQGGWGIITQDCDCIENSNQYDCPDLQLNVGDGCGTTDAAVIDGVVTQNCDCELLNNEFDCENLQLNIGDACSSTPGGGFLDGVVSADCDCITNSIYDCENLQADYGDDCWLVGNVLGSVNQSCECE